MFFSAETSGRDYLWAATEAERRGRDRKQSPLHLSWNSDYFYADVSKPTHTQTLLKISPSYTHHVHTKRANMAAVTPAVFSFSWYKSQINTRYVKPAAGLREWPRLCCVSFGPLPAAVCIKLRALRLIRRSLLQRVGGEARLPGDSHVGRSPEWARHGRQLIYSVHRPALHHGRGHYRSVNFQQIYYLELTPDNRGYSQRCTTCPAG